MHESDWQEDLINDIFSNNETARTLLPPEVGGTQKLSLRECCKKNSCTGNVKVTDVSIYGSNLY